MGKSISKPITLIVIGLLFNVGLRAQSIYFNYTNGTNASYNLEDVRKITFDADLMNLHFWDSSVYAWNVSTIGYYQYDASLNVHEWLNIANAWDVSIYPNPSDGNQSIKLKLPQATELSFSIIDISGKQIYQQKLGELSKGEYTFPIDWSNASAGSYTIILKSNDFSVTKKLIKK